MPELIPVLVYELSELSPEARATAINTARDDGVFDVDSDELLSYMKYKLEEYGLPTETVEFSLGHCQGDGVAFYGNIDVEKLLKNIGEWDALNRILVQKYELSATITRNSWGTHYSHYNTMDVYMERGHEYQSNASRLRGKELWELLKLRVVSVSKELEAWGYERIAYNQSEEYITECIEENDYRFRDDGRIWA